MCACLYQQSVTRPQPWLLLMACMKKPLLHAPPEPQTLCKGPSYAKFFTVLFFLIPYVW